jgi:hypothetical protein
MSNIQLDIKSTHAVSRKIEKLMPRDAKNKDAYLALPPVECLPMEGDVLFSARTVNTGRLLWPSVRTIMTAAPTGPSS